MVFRPVTLALFVFSALTFAQDTSRANSKAALDEVSNQAPYCIEIARGLDNAAALTSACEFVSSLKAKLPNVICDQETTRFTGKPGNRGLQEKTARLEDTVKAHVRYFDGTQEYSEIHINGKPQSAPAESYGRAAWGKGEYGPLVQLAFSRDAAVRYRFAREELLRSVPAFLFEFQIDQRNNKQWLIAEQYGSDLQMYPGINGRLWLDKSTAHILRLEMDAVGLKDFPLNIVSHDIDYADIPSGDGSSFVLPTASELYTCNRNAHICGLNITTFSNCHKFRAKGRMLPETPPPVLENPTNNKP